MLFMQSDGGLTPMSSFNGSRAILSGPAGGVVSIKYILFTDNVHYRYQYQYFPQHHGLSFK